MTALDKLPNNSLAFRDHANQQAAGDPEELLTQVAVTTGRSEDEMYDEIVQGREWDGQITMLDYITYRLYNVDAAQRKEFISDWLHWPIHECCDDSELSPRTVDKWQCTDMLIQAGIPTIPISAMIDRNNRYGDTRTVTNGNELLAMLIETDSPLFAKPNNLLGSFGAFIVDGVDNNQVVYGDQKASPDAMITEVMADVPYLLQPVIRNHKVIRAMTESLATIRTINLVAQGNVRMAAAVIKIPAGNNLADNFWRAGNLIGNIDLDTGVISRSVQGSGENQIEHSVHPDTGAQLKGAQLPFWDEILDLNDRTARLFDKIAYQSQDIAITDDGPIVVEVNSGSSFALPQIASGNGFLTEENQRFFESQGVDFETLPGAPGL